MRGAWRLVEHLAGLVGPFRLTRNLGDDRTFQHVGQDEASVMMGLANPSGREWNFAHRHLPTIQRQVGKIVLKHGALANLASLTLRATRGLGEQRKRDGHGIAPVCQGLNQLLHCGPLYIFKLVTHLEQVVDQPGFY